MVDLKDISIITHIRIDNDDRLENIRLRNEIMLSLSVNAEIIIVEDDRHPKLEDEFKGNSSIKYLKFHNEGNYNKNKAYNIGGLSTDRKYLVFLDADCIIHPRFFKGVTSDPTGIEDMMLYPYNRYALYLNPNAKIALQRNISYDTLTKFTPKIELKHGLMSKYGHLFGDCPGGAFMMTRDFFSKINGFNPNFTGWGYEDTAFLTRIRRLEYKVGLIGGPDAIMFHLHHGDVSRGEVATRRVLTSKSHNNRALYKSVNNMTKDQAEKYSNTWSLYD